MTGALDSDAAGPIPRKRRVLPAAVVDVMTTEFHRSYFVDTEGLPGLAEGWDNGIFRSLWYPHYLLVAEKSAD